MNEAQLQPPVAADVSAVEIIRGLSYRAARKRFRIGYAAWSAIHRGELAAWQPARTGRCTSDELVHRVLESVRSAPHLATVPRSLELGLRTETVQGILAARGLSKLTARLTYAGYQVDVVRPLQIARSRRVLAARPGCYSHIDHKTFGVVRRLADEEEVPVCGCVVVDSLTGFATVRLSRRADSASAVAAFEKHIACAPFPVTGIVLSDNGKAFLSDEFIAHLAAGGFIQRTTRFNHPWSNGKVEALNKTLKYQAMPPLVAGRVHSLDALQTTLDAWMEFYNTKRAHSGWVNKGLPPAVLAALWARTPGSDVEKLYKLHILRPGDERRMRVLGAPAVGKPWAEVPLADARGTPYAYVIEAEQGKPMRGGVETPAPQPPRDNNFALAK